MACFRDPELRIDRKPDLTPVTEADTRIERELREIISAVRPDDAVVGEEFGATGAPDATWRWVIDPIDGTKSFARGNEAWATLIALQYERKTVVAVASVPTLRHRYHAILDGGAFLNRDQLHVSTTALLDASVLSHTSLSGFIRCALEDDLVRLSRECWDARGFGNSLSHLAVARGSADIGWTSRAREWDFAALALIVKEAGGRFTDPNGNATVEGGGLSSNGHLHDQVLRLIGEGFSRRASL